VYVCVGLVSLCDFVFFVIFYGFNDSLAPNEDNVRFSRGGGNHIPLYAYFCEVFHFLYHFSSWPSETFVRL